MNPFRHTITVPFYDVDAMRVVWHGNYVKYFEEARCAFFAAHGISYDDFETAGFLLPVVGLNIKYIHPSHFQQSITIEVTLEDNDNFVILHYLATDTQTGKKICKGMTKHVAIERDSREVCFELPAEFVRCLHKGEKQ